MIHQRDAAWLCEAGMGAFQS